MRTVAAQGFPQGGLVVQLGASDTSTVSRLAETGRYVIHLLETDSSVIHSARTQLRNQKLYGLASVDQFPSSGKLPYTENLVNVVGISKEFDEAIQLSEIVRVLCPNGFFLTPSKLFTPEGLQAAGLSDVSTSADEQWTIARKPWPKEMDQWSHPRHSASGNAVSSDLSVGPPRRIRWVVGADSEVPGLVTANGRNFYSGILARDSFNGLRLWSLDVTNPLSDKNFVLKRLPKNSPQPVSDGKHVYVVMNDHLQALNAATGEVERDFGEVGDSHTVLHDGGTVISVSDKGVRALDTNSGALKWSFAASQPRCVVAGDETVSLIQGNRRRGETSEAVVLNKETGLVQWRRDDLSWLNDVDQSVYHNGLVAYEVSTLNDNGPENTLHILNAVDGQAMLDHDFLPGMNHKRQARAMFIGDDLWVLHGGKDADKNRLPTQISSINMLTGRAVSTLDAGLAHCFPPVATPRFMFSGELDLTDLKTGEVDANRITKANCNADFGWLPANGLVYVTPKHCVCWPMLRGYAALATDRPNGNPALKPIDELEFSIVKGVAASAIDNAGGESQDWASYRHDEWRSNSTLNQGPEQLNPIWRVDLGDMRSTSGAITKDWDENPFIKGPISPPVIAAGRVFVTRPDAHQVLAFDANTAKPIWQFDANGRVDTPPTIHQGLCLFGSKSGMVYCLRANDGQLVWKIQAAPLDERIVAYGQIESPWPVPGSVLVVDDIAYFAAGRQSLADGGVLLFSVEVATGKINWTQRLDTIPQKGFYNSSGLEFDNFDLLHREGNGVAMSRWVFDREDGSMNVDPWRAYAKLNTGGGESMVPQGSWSYAPRHQTRTSTHEAKRSPVAFRGQTLVGSTQNKKGIYLTEFNKTTIDEFETKWLTGWAAGRASREGGTAWRSQRLAEKSKWQVTLFDKENDKREVAAMILAADKIFIADSEGGIQVRSTTDGEQIWQSSLPTVMWDGLAIANGRLFVSTQDGQLICLGGNK